MSNFSNRFNELLFEQNISIEELSKKLDISVQTIYNWKNNTKQITLSNLTPLCNELKCSIDFISGRSEHILTFIPKTPPQFYAAIRQAMKNKAITTSTLRKETRFDGSYFARWNKGADPYLSTLIELSDYFDCSIDYLVGRES